MTGLSATAAPTQFAPIDVLTAAAVAITARGYYQPLSRQDEPAVPTAMDVTAILTGRGRVQHGDGALFARTRPQVEGIPEDVRGWCLAGTGEPDSYRARLATLAGQAAVSERDIPLLASAVASWQKDQRRAAAARQQETDAERSTHVGEKGQRITAPVTVAAVIRLADSEYGHTVQRRYLIKFRDDAGRILVWKATTDNVPSNGARITVAGTVTRHDTYRGTAETYINRCRWTAIEPAQS
ncbi:MULTISPECIES: hypothetical protein [Streptomyces]|uniref:Uncharacterized protein n=1 Tax=Streptomyces clavifer TaxID=68188 RepID=A0ABS4VID4_9ACTN|nr:MULTISPECIES: hypothetical protein [Streptomyces]MBP2363354.1 hypothetical protein [Streptomyces clavifer]MDX2748500.1 hypothetical protein [Streptomyces sp. NRRL_B-2557]GHB30874.1 hypothetical protein GCM10010392_68630 [Streptomyces clavifer]